MHGCGEKPRQLTRVHGAPHATYRLLTLHVNLPGRCADGSLEAQARLAQLPAGAKEVDLFDFESGLPSAPRWFSMDDSIMVRRFRCT